MEITKIVFLETPHLSVEVFWANDDTPSGEIDNARFRIHMDLNDSMTIGEIREKAFEIVRSRFRAAE